MPMTIRELAAALASLELPLAYGAFINTPENPAPPPPFIVYQFDHSTDLMADNRNYAEVSTFRVELYTPKKDIDRETALEALLKSLAQPYSKSETWIDSERMFLVAYEIQVI
jgi:predicted dienelactone hydrolase